MVNKKNNVPYYIVGSLATLALLASGVFAAAPYVQVQFLAPILAPIAALGLSAPLIAVCAAFSAVVIAFSAIVVNKNRTLSKKETLLVNKTEEIKDKNKTIAEQEAQLANETEEIKDKNKTIAEQETELVNKTEEIEAQNQTIAEIKAQLAENVREIQSQSKRVIDSYIKGQPLREARKANKTAVEGDMHLESLFENISGDGVAQPRSDLLYEVSHNGKELVFAPELSDYLKASLEQEKLLMKVATGLGKAFTSTKEAFSDDRALNIVKRDILLPSVEVATELGKAFTSTKEAFSDGRALNIVKRDILLPSVEVATELGKAFTSTKEAFSDGRALNIVKRDILLPSVEVATELGKAFTSTKEAFSDGRALNIVKRDILLPSVEVATELGKAGFTYTKEKLAKAYMVFTEIGGSLTEKIKAGEWFSSRQVLGAEIGATFGLACLLAQRFISPTSNALSPANDFTDVADLYNNDCPNSSYTHPNNTQAILGNKLDQVEKMLNLSQKRDNDNFGVDPNKRNFVDDKAPEEFTLPQANGIVEQNISTSVSSAAKYTVFGDIGQDSEVQEYVYGKRACYERSSCHSGDYQAPLPGLQGMTICCPSIAKSAPPSGP